MNLGKDLLFLFLLISVLGSSLLVINIYGTEVKIEDTKEADRAIAEAKILYKKAVQSGVNLSDGPCLSNDLMPGWVADLVHDPKTVEDEVISSQCPAYHEGRAHHFVELDLGGNVVRVK